MNFYQINLIARSLPSDKKLGRVSQSEQMDLPYGGANPMESEEEVPMHLYVPRDALPFLHNYSRVMFGWDAAQRFAAAAGEMPVILTGGDIWVYKSWAAMSHGSRVVTSQEMKILTDAWNMRFKRSCRPSGIAVEALLLTPDATVESVAEDTGLPYELVEAYEALFYNVIGRRDDYMFLRNIVYPNSRLDEIIPGFLSATHAERLVKRVAYNSDRKTALYMCGFRPDGILEQTVEEASKRFQRLLLQTGAIMAAGGLLMFDRAHTTISAARSFIQTSKLSGEDLGGDSGMLSLADSLRGDIDRISKAAIAEANREAGISAPA